MLPTGHGDRAKISPMATAIPLSLPLPEPVASARARLRAAGIDPVSVPHAGAGTIDGFRREIGELMALGLAGEELVAVLAGPAVFSTADPAEMMAYLESLPACAPSS
jgi:hypothetical protein